MVVYRPGTPFDVAVPDVNERENVDRADHERLCRKLSHDPDTFERVASRYTDPERVPALGEAIRRVVEGCKAGLDAKALQNDEFMISYVDLALMDAGEVYGYGFHASARWTFELVEVSLACALFLSLVYASFVSAGSTVTWALGVIGIVVIALLRLAKGDGLELDEMGIGHLACGLALTSLAILVLACRTPLARRGIGGVLVASALLMPAFCVLAVVVLVVKILDPAYVGASHGLAIPSQVVDHAIPIITGSALLSAPWWGSLLDEYRVTPRPR